MRLHTAANRLKHVLSSLTTPEKWLYRRGFLSTADMTLPDMIGIGMARSGTTWLYRNLMEHPQVQRRPRPKELHYFNNHFGRPLRWYAAQFDHGDGLRFEITPGYAHLAVRRIDFIRSILPDVKILVLFREPTAQAWSETVLHRVGKQATSLDNTDQDRFLATLREVAEAADYVQILDRWESVFPREQIFVGFFDDLVTRPRGLLSDVFEFLGLTRQVDWCSFPYAEKANAAVPIAIPSHYREVLREINQPRIEAMRRRFGPRVDGWFEAS